MEQKWVKEKKAYGRHHTRVPNVTYFSTMIGTSAHVCWRLQQALGAKNLTRRMVEGYRERI